MTQQQSNEEKWVVLPNGISILRFPNEDRPGYTYMCDEVKGGVTAWDTNEIRYTTMKAILNDYEELVG